MSSRREFVSRLAAGAIAPALLGRTLGAQDVQAQDSMPGMTGQARPVRLPPKPKAGPSMTNDARDTVEHRLHCQCGTCTLDVYTCRTTDFKCRVSPAMHRDVMALVEGGYSADEILRAFQDTYGERVLMAPTKSGFNLVGWILPGLAVAAGAVAVAMVLRRWGAARSRVAAPVATRAPLGIDATPEELARLEAAIRSDDA